MGQLTGKVALITGAARGQGRSHAVRLAEEGADVIAIDSCTQIDSVPYPMSTPEDLAQTVKEVEHLDRRISAHQADVRDPGALAAAVQAGVAALGPVDIVVANAGIFSGSSTAEMSDRMWQDMIDVNLTGVFNTIRATAPDMVTRGAGGSIILISSAAGIRGVQGVPHYVAAKHGVVGLMKSWAAEYGPARIRVNSVHPTCVPTPMVDNEPTIRMFRPDLDAPSLQDLGDAYRGFHLMPEGWVTERDISAAVLFLASDEGRFVTGQQFKVDLGLCERW